MEESSRTEPLAGRTLRLKFYLNKADLYSFWISEWQTGESGGYTGGGGPGLSDKGIDIPVNKLVLQEKNVKSLKYNYHEK